jgi:hypothetical protein
MEADQQANSKVLNFRPRALPAVRHRKDNPRSNEDICRLLDLSRYEMRREGLGDFRKRMIANLAALLLLITFASLAAVDVHRIARSERCVRASECVPSVKY